MMALPKPYYETPLGKLYHGDCLEIMPHLPKVDLVLTDPPYGINYRSNHRKNPYNLLKNDDTYPLLEVETAMRLTNNAVYIFGRWENIYVIPKPKSVLVWMKNNWSMGDLKHEHGRQWEAIFFYPQQNHKFKKRIPDILKYERTGNVVHPTQKPVGIFIQIIRSNSGHSVLDPFLGSGTTAVACERLNRQWIGIEIEEKYCEIAAKRIEKERQQLKLF